MIQTTQIKCSAPGCDNTKGTFVYSEATNRWYCLVHPVARMIIKLDSTRNIVDTEFPDRQYCMICALTGNLGHHKTTEHYN